MKPEVNHDQLVYAQTFVGKMKLDINDASDEHHIYFLDIADGFYPQGLYFMSTQNRVLQALYFLNRDYILGSIVTLNELYSYLFLPTTDYGNTVGWSTEDGAGWLDFDIVEVPQNDGRIFYKIAPLFDPDSECLKYY